MAGVLYILHGLDDFSLEQELQRIRASMEDEMLSINTTVLEGAQTTPPEVMVACDTVPFLGRHRLVIVQRLLRRFEPPQHGRGHAQPGPSLGPWQALVDYAERLPESTVLVLTDGELSPGNSLLSPLAAVAKVKEFRPLKYGAVLEEWIQRRAGDKGMLLSAQAVRLLADSLGNDLWALDRELEKLATYAPGRRIEEDDVRTLVGPARAINIFSLVDAVVEGRASAALRLLRQLMGTGVEGLHLLALLERQYRLLLLAQEWQREGASPQEIAQHLGIGKPFVLRKVLEQAALYRLPRLKSAYRRLLEADLAIKRGQQDPGLALDLLIADLAGQRVG